MNTDSITLEEIKKVHKENVGNLQEKFLKFQSSFFSQIYKRYNKDLDKGIIILNFYSNTHRSILRVRENDLFHNISLNNFWSNCEIADKTNLKVISIAKKTGLPKETARRKVIELIDKKILFLNKDKKILWKPSSINKKIYNNLIEEEIKEIAKFINVIGLNLKVSLSEGKIIEEIKKYFSFYWYHYLKSQLSYLKNWKKKYKDLELYLISIECVLQAAYNSKNYNIASNSISNITGIPRSTCIRKLETLTKMKFLKKDNNTKKFLIDFKNFNSNIFIGKELYNSGIDSFSYLFFVMIKAIDKPDSLKS